MITAAMVDLASETLGSPVDPDWLGDMIAFYRPLSLENLQRLLWEELHNLVSSDYRDAGAAETASAIRAVMAIRRM